MYSKYRIAPIVVDYQSLSVVLRAIISQLPLFIANAEVETHATGKIYFATIFRNKLKELIKYLCALD